MAQVTNAEYQKVQDAMSNQFTADSINQYRTDYNNYLSQGMSSKDAFAKARNVLVEKTPTTPSNTPNNQNQGAGNYVYNEQTGYYEQTPSNTPTTPTPEVKQEVKQEETAGNTTPEIQQQGELKPLSQEYYNQTGDAAQSKIINNLNGYRQTNPELFSDYDTFKRNFSYDLRNEEQKQTLDNWYNGYEKGMQLSSVPTTELYTQYKDGQISTNDLENLRISNPTKYAELQNQINKGNIIAAYDDDKGQDGTGLSLQDMAYNMAVQTFNKFMMGDGSSEASKYFADYKANMDSPEMLGLSDQCTEIQEQMENTQSDLDSIKKQVEKEYEGTGASRSKINAIISDRSYELQLQLRTLNSEYNKYATQYNNRMQQYQNEFQMQLQEYQINQDARNQQMKELGFAMDLMNFETNEQKQQREWDYWVMQQEYQDGNINSKDPAVQLKAIQNSVDDLLKNYAGISTNRSSVEIAQDIQTAIKNGSSLGAELTKLNKQMQSKPEYKLMYNATYNGKQTLGTINGKSAVISYDAAGNYTGYELLNTTPNSINNSNRGSQIKSFSDVWDISSNSWDNYVANLENAVQLGSWGGQCGAGANDILTGAGANKVFGNSLSDKIKVCDNKFGANASNDYSRLKKGDFVVLDTGAKLQDGTLAGHVGVIKGIDLTNGTITVFDTNGQAGKECWGESTYKLGIVRGSYDPRTQASFREVENTEQPTAERWNAMNSMISDPGYSTEDIGVYDKYLKGTSPSEKYIENKGGWDVFKAEVRAYQQDKANNKVTANEALYAPFNNPMADAYETAMVGATTEAKSKSLNDAFNFYSQTYSMLNDGSLQELANDGDLQEIIKDAYNKRNRNNVKSDVFTYMYNKKLTDNQRMALNQLKRLCEIKLRKESGAAINAEERESAYEFFFPAIGESSEYSMNKILNNVNSTVGQWFLNGGVSRSDFIPISADMITDSSTQTPSTSAPENIDYFEEWRPTQGTTYTVGEYTIEW